MTSLDWILAAGLTLILVWVVVISRRFSKDVSTFIVGGRKTRMWLGLSNDNSGGLGLVAIAYLGQEGFRHGFSLTWIYLIGAVMVVVVFGICGFGIQRFRASKAMTGGQFHEMRYSRGLRLIVGIGLGMGGILNMAAFPIIGARFITAFLAWPNEINLMGATIPIVPVLTACMILLAVFFAVVCGQVGVILTDYIQGVVIMGGLFAINWIIFSNVGIGAIKDTLDAEMGSSAFNPFVWGSYGILWIVWRLASHMSSPFCFGPQMAKNAAAENPKVTRMLALVTQTFAQGKTLLMISLGVGAFIALHKTARPEGMEQAAFERIVTPMYLASITPPILKGLLLSAFIFAFISTNDTYILSWSSIIVNDVVCVFKRKSLSTKQHLWLLRITIISIGVFLYFWGVFIVDKLGNTILNYLTLTGSMFFGAAVAMIAGLYWKRANTAAAYCAVLSGIILPIVHLTLQNTLPPETYTIPDRIAGLATIFTSAILLVIVSLLSHKPTRFIDYSEAVKQSEAND